MANPEIKITIETTNAIVLTTTDKKGVAQKEAFVNVEDALVKKEKEVRDRIIALPIRAIGIAGFFGGIGLFTVGIVNRNLVMTAAGASAISLSNIFIYLTQKPIDKGKLAIDQLREIKKSSGVKDSSDK